MRNLLLVLGLACLSTQAFGQGVTLADLQGSVIDVSAIHHEKIVRGGEIMLVELHTSGRVTVGAGKAIDSQFQTTADNQTTGRTRSGPTTSFAGTLDKPGQGTEGNDLLWTFINGSLVRLRVFSGGAGANKMTISFRRTANGLACRFSMPMAREVGVGRIQKGSQIDQTPIEILEFTLVSSSCQVSKS